MKKHDLATLAVLGISAGLIVGGCQSNTKNTNGRQPYSSNQNTTATERMTPDMQAFYASLSSSAKRKFDQMDAQHKMMAMEMANQRCNGQNKCAGMGGCSTAEHDCAGKNGCEGQGGAPIRDPNKAVDTLYKSQQKTTRN